MQFLFNGAKVDLRKTKIYTEQGRRRLRTVKRVKKKSDTRHNAYLGKKQMYNNGVHTGCNPCDCMSVTMLFSSSDEIESEDHGTS